MLVVSKRGGHLQLVKRLKEYDSKQLATAVVFSKRGGHLQLGKRLKDYYSNTNSDSACRFEKGRTYSVWKEIEGLLFKYK